MSETQTTISNIYKRATNNAKRRRKHPISQIVVGCRIENGNQLTFSNGTGYTVEECLIKAHYYGYTITKLQFNSPLCDASSSFGYDVRMICTGKMIDGTKCYAPYTCGYGYPINWVPSHITHIVLSDDYNHRISLSKYIEYLDLGHRFRKPFVLGCSNTMPKYLKHYIGYCSCIYMNTMPKHLDTIQIYGDGTIYMGKLPKNTRTVCFYCYYGTDGFPKKLNNLTLKYHLTKKLYGPLSKRMNCLKIRSDHDPLIPDELKMLHITVNYSPGFCTNEQLFDNLPNTLTKIIYPRYMKIISKPNNCVLEYGE